MDKLPSIGDAVQYLESTEDGLKPLDATITAVHSDICINLTLPGTDSMRDISCVKGSEPGCWRWPVAAAPVAPPEE